MPEEPSFREDESNFEIPPDRDDDFSDDSDEKPADKGPQNQLRDFTFIPGSNEKDGDSPTQPEVDMSKLASVEQIREYLETELGIDLLMKIYPIIKAFGDDILFMDKMQDLKDQLKPHITEAQVDRYHIMFSTLVFYELEIEKANQESQLGKPNAQPSKPHDPSSMLNAVNCFKDVAATATFGKFGLTQTIGKRR